MKLAKAQLGLYAIGAAGIFLALYLLRKRGLLKTVGQAIVGEEGIGGAIGDIIAGEDLEVRAVSATEAPSRVLATASTVPTPGTEKQFVIRYSGKIHSPVDGGNAERNLFSSEYYVDAEVINATDTSVSAPIVIKTGSGIYTADVTIPAGGSVRRKIPCRLANRWNPFGPSETATLTFLGRWLDSVSFDA